jgi:hypothetical protein
MEGTKTQGKGTEGATPIMAARKDQKPSALDALIGDEAEAPQKDQKLRLVFKGTALADLLKVMGGKVKDGEKQVSFVVPGGKGDKEVGDVLRLLIHKYAESGVTLADLVSLLNRDPEGEDQK